MKTIQVGRPIEVDENTARLLQLISEGQWQQIDRDVLRSIIPDTNLFVEFLERYDLTDTAEAKVVLRRLGIEATEPQVETAVAAPNYMRARAKKVAAKKAPAKKAAAKKAAAKKAAAKKAAAKKAAKKALKKPAKKAAKKAVAKKAAAKKMGKAMGRKKAKPGRK